MLLLLLLTAFGRSRGLIKVVKMAMVIKVAKMVRVKKVVTNNQVVKVARVHRWSLMAITIIR